jgi:hypothetical protein
MNESSDGCTNESLPTRKQTGRRGPRHLLSYGASIAAGVACGFLLGGGWDHPPNITTHHAGLPATSSETSDDIRPHSSLVTPSFPANAIDATSAEVAPPSASTVSAANTTPFPSPTFMPTASQDDALNVPPPNAPETNTSEHKEVLQRAARAVPSPSPAPPPPVSHKRQQAQKTPSRHDMHQQPAPTPVYIVQVGAFRLAANAQKNVSHLRAKGYTPSIFVIRDAKNRLWHRVYIEQFSDGSRAQATATAFKEAEKTDAYALLTTLEQLDPHTKAKDQSQSIGP